MAFGRLTDFSKTTVQTQNATEPEVYRMHFTGATNKSCELVFQEEEVNSFFKSGHTNNWAVLVDTSRFWFNYRHVANVLSVYRSVKRLGIPDRYERLTALVLKNIHVFMGQ